MLANGSIINDTALPVFTEDEFDRENNENEDAELNISKSIKIRNRKLFVHPYDYSIRSLKEQVEDGTLVLADDFQRRRVWDDTKASRLIESLLINVPIPVCYFAELEDSSCSVIDGQQRLTAIYRYLNDEFKLKSLKIRDDLNKLKFSQLSIVDQRSIKLRIIRCIVILKDSDPEIRFDVFDRLNSNSVKLNRQELRNSLYKGSLNNLVKELSKHEIFKKLRRAKDVEKRMNDCEIILRFFALYFNGANYQGKLSKFLDDYLESGMKFNSEKIEQHREIFLKTIDIIHSIFGENSFRRYAPTERVWKSAINRAVYDVLMLSVFRLSLESLEHKRDEIISEFTEIFKDPNFEDAIASQPEKVTQMQSRLDLWRDRLECIGIPLERIIIGMTAHETM